MKIKLDENMPSRLAEMLSQLGHDVDTVMSEGLSGRDDDTVWNAAQEAGRFIITQDLDFSDTRIFAPGTHYGILLIRLRDPGRIALTERVLVMFAVEDIENWTGCFVVATDHKIRIRKP